MPRASSNILDSGDTFPSLTLNLTDGGTLNVPGDQGDNWKVVLLFRGYF